MLPTKEKERTENEYQLCDLQFFIFHHYTVQSELNFIGAALSTNFQIVVH